MVKILYVIGQLGFGGAERQLLYLLKGLDRSKYLPELCVLDANEIIPEFKSLKLPITFLQRHFPRYDLTRFFKLLYIIRQVSPKLLHAFLGVANFYTGMAGLITGIPVIISERNAHSRPFPCSLDRWFSHIMVRRASRVVANSLAGADFVVHRHGLSKKNVIVVHNGLDPTPFDAPQDISGIRQALGLKPKTVVIGIVGTINGSRKDHATFLHAMRCLKNRGSLDFQVLCVGTGPMLEQTIKLSQELGLGSITLFPGRINDNTKIMASLDILVSSSQYEGLPNVIMEAMAARKPVVATAVGGTPELVVNGKTGFLVPPKTPSALADKIQFLLENPELAMQMGEAGCIRLQQEFSLSKMIKCTESIYESLLSDKGVLS